MLEKILEELEERIEMVGNIPTSYDKGEEFPDGEECYEDGRTQGRYEELLWCRNIIRKHMNDNWIPVECELPGEPESGSDLKEYIVTIDGAEESTSLFYGGAGVWMDIDANWYKAIAWQPLPEPYRKGGEDETEAK